jgi:hypothetical protein
MICTALDVGRSFVAARIIPAEPLVELDLPTLALELGGQLLLGRQVELVARREDLRGRGR